MDRYEKIKAESTASDEKGVITLSSTFSNVPEIAINTPAATPIAISLAQVAKKMLLSNDPIGLNITPLTLNAPKNH
jgi:hypothetical protein